MKFKPTLWILILLLLTVACGPDGPAETLERPENLPIPTADFDLGPSEAGLTGQVLNSQNQPLVNVEVRLAQVFWDANQNSGAYVIEGGSSPTTVTGEDGRFLFRNLEPFDYVVVVGDLFGQHVVISNDDDTATIYTVGADALKDVGVLQVDLASAPAVPVLPTPADAPYPGPLPTPLDDDSAYP